MGLFDNLLGNASEVDAGKLEGEFKTLLAQGEQIEHAYRLFRDLLVFTNKRFITVDKEGTGKKRTYMSVPYSSITKFSKESSARFETDAVITLWIRGDPKPTVLEFGRDKSIDDVYRVLSTYILR